MSQFVRHSPANTRYDEAVPKKLTNDRIRARERESCLAVYVFSEAVFPACRLVTPGRDPLEARPRSCPFGVLLAVVGVVLGRALPTEDPSIAN